jgi:hypothetical protein
MQCIHPTSICHIEDLSRDIYHLKGTFMMDIIPHTCHYLSTNHHHHSPHKEFSHTYHNVQGSYDILFLPLINSYLQSIQQFIGMSHQLILTRLHTPNIHLDWRIDNSLPHIGSINYFIHNSSQEGRPLNTASCTNRSHHSRNHIQNNHMWSKSKDISHRLYPARNSLESMYSRKYVLEVCTVLCSRDIRKHYYQNIPNKWLHSLFSTHDQLNSLFPRITADTFRSAIHSLLRRFSTQKMKHKKHNLHHKQHIDLLHLGMWWKDIPPNTHQMTTDTLADS